jgi:hypothetical protein
MLASSDRNHYLSVTGTANLAYRVEQDGFAIVPSCLNEELIQSLAAQLSEDSYAKRNLLALPIVRELATSPAVRNLAETVLGKHCFAVKATFFNKTQESRTRPLDCVPPTQRDRGECRHERSVLSGKSPSGLPTTQELSLQAPTEMPSAAQAIDLHLKQTYHFGWWARLSNPLGRQFPITA